MPTHKSIDYIINYQQLNIIYFILKTKCKLVKYLLVQKEV